MKWLIQNNIDTLSIKNIIHELEKRNEEVFLIDFPYSTDTNFEEKQERIKTTLNNISGKTFCFGSVNFVDLIRKYKIQPGALNQNIFCLSQVYEYLKNKNILLNEDAIFTTPNDFKKEKLNKKIYFIRPDMDNKAFNGRICSTQEIESFMSNAKHRNTKKINKDTVFLISPLKDVKNEIRCFVIGGKLSTASYYRIDYIVKSKRITESDTLFNIIDNYIKNIETHYKPSDSYVVDFSLNEKQNLKVIEYNSLPNSGLYSCSVTNILDDLISFYS